MDHLFPIPPRVPVLSQLPHIIQFYSDDNFLLDGWGRLISNAVETGDAAICVITTAHSEGLAKRLSLHGEQVTAASEQGRYITLDAAEIVSAVTSEGSFNGARFLELVEPVIAKARAATEDKASQVFILGEGVALLWLQAEYDGVILWERMWNGLAQANSLSLRCFYPLEALNFQAEQGNCEMLCAQHSATVLPIGLPMLSGEKALIWTEVELKQVLRQAQQIIQREAHLGDPKWLEEYRAALLETDRKELFKRVEAAQAAVMTRQELWPEQDNLHERLQLMRALSGLQIIKREKLGFFE
jgi:MEDS: MEthanogen/methylotroph, DcmR Sensory domain